MQLFSKYPESNRRRGGATPSGGRWGLSPYSALAAELNFGNEGLLECGTITQVRQRLAAPRSPGIRPRSKAANGPSRGVPKTASIPLLHCLFGVDRCDSFTSHKQPEPRLFLRRERIVRWNLARA